jgi:hypothetical protein
MSRQRYNKETTLYKQQSRKKMRLNARYLILLDELDTLPEHPKEYGCMKNYNKSKRYAKPKTESN